MGIYGEGIGGKPHVRNFDFRKDGDRDQDRASTTPRSRCPVAPEDWPKFWKHGEWNELQARIDGNPPTITTWIKGVKFMEYTGHREAARRQGRHRPAGPRRRRLHEAVRPLPQHPREGTGQIGPRGPLGPMGTLPAQNVSSARKNTPSNPRSPLRRASLPRWASSTGSKPSTTPNQLWNS